MLDDLRALLKEKNFLYLWTSQILSQLTVNIMNFLLLTHLYDVTQSSIATSFLWVCYSLPALIIGPIGAASVDLFSRRKMLIVTNFFQAVVVFLYIFINQQSIFLLYFIVLAYSTLNQFYGPAESASLPGTVGKDMFSRANSLFFITLQLTLVIGFGIAGILQKAVGFNGALILCTLFLVIAFVSVTFLPSDKPVKSISGDFEKILKTFFDSILEGYNFIKENKTILFPLLILLGIQAGLAIVIVSLPQIATEILNISVSYSGVSIVVPAGIGALIGSIYIPKLLKKDYRKKTVIEISLALITFTALAISLGIPYLPIALRVSITLILIILTGIAFIGVNIPSLTFLQEATPEWFRGRVFGNLWFMITVVTIIPVLFSGAISELFGIRTMIVILAMGTLSALIYSYKNGQAIIEEHFKEK